MCARCHPLLEALELASQEVALTHTPREVLLTLPLLPGRKAGPGTERSERSRATLLPQAGAQRTFVQLHSPVFPPLCPCS